MAAKRSPKPIEYASNRWRGCVPPGAAALRDAEAFFGRPVPAAVRDLLAVCAGGAPERSFYMSPTYRIEVAIGHVLHVKPPKTKARSITSALQTLAADSARIGVSDADLTPFAVDNGNAHFLCVDGAGRVVYRLLHEARGQERSVVADSLADFLQGLTAPPF